MKKVLMYESSVIEGKLMEHALEQANKDVEISSVIFWEENPEIMLRQMPDVETESPYDFLMINLDKRDQNYPTDNLIRKFREMSSYQNAYILIWVNPLKHIPSWEFDFGQGCFAQKPFEFDRLIKLLSNKLDDSNRSSKGEA